ncbi:signal transduction protein [Veronia nyctiphanis]|uniref:Signal transduction protein n=1 Tax=Veronia nyctiphanis TaxID=1278244 RepID=A0A4V1LTD6_9GAMM|nr:EAL domain-containing protein [Veronia nyctiphanis]RXJ74828.1 signal transduction protein [Veronia nyctiphanis]
MDAGIARQAIFDRNKNLYGYELLYRHGKNNHFPNIDGDKATDSVLKLTFDGQSSNTQFISNGLPCFVNFTHNKILDNTPFAYPNSKLIIEVLESCQIDGSLISALKKLRRHGYTIAFDDFQPTRNWLDILYLADIVKIDYSALSTTTISQLIKVLPDDRQFKLVAEKLEYTHQIDHAISLGFDLLQGYGLKRPELMELDVAAA